jgi:hypothetical protein
VEDKQDKPQDQSESKNNSEEEVSIVHKVKTVSDGSTCEHEFIDDYVDSENKQHQQCTKCWSGRWR